MDKHFSKDKNLQKVFNRNNIKVSYSCTQNIGSIINSHNKKVAVNQPQHTPDCNCREKNNCPLQGNCRVKSVIYNCDVTAPNHPKKTYIGLTEREFKQRHSGHKQSINNIEYRNSTTLSTFVWSLKNKEIVPSLNWSIVRHVKAYSNTTKSCPLRLQEKLEIL